MPVELRALEQLAAEGGRLWVALDEVKALKTRMSSARRLVDEVLATSSLHLPRSMPDFSLVRCANSGANMVNGCRACGILSAVS